MTFSGLLVLDFWDKKVYKHFKVNLLWDRYFTLSPSVFSWITRRFVKSVLSGQWAIPQALPLNTGLTMLDGLVEADVLFQIFIMMVKAQDWSWRTLLA